MLPAFWRSKFEFLFVLSHPLLFQDRLDKGLWKSRNNKVMPFSVNSAWSDLLVPKPIVPWCNIMWLSQNIPKNAFILWLAFNKRLNTQDKVAVWNKVDLLKRPLCNSMKDDHDHLFFGCDFSIRVWEHLKDLMSEGKVVCVRGASGFIASWIVKLLLARGYSVHATVRSLGDQKKTEHLFALDGAKERLSLYEANLIEDGSFDSAVKRC
nr:putative bifunctional polymyxin resistance protein, ArnA [Tanacetum cinerariifolium]GFA14339.1 putative bifunctional polymyxin resistance protein, ArnA [Tanacetum cinerariifolium]